MNAVTRKLVGGTKWAEMIVWFFRICHFWDISQVSFLLWYLGPRIILILSATFALIVSYIWIRMIWLNFFEKNCTCLFELLHEVWLGSNVDCLCVARDPFSPPSVGPDDACIRSCASLRTDNIRKISRVYFAWIEEELSSWTLIICF